MSIPNGFEYHLSFDVVQSQGHADFIDGDRKCDFDFTVAADETQALQDSLKNIQVCHAADPGLVAGRTEDWIIFSAHTLTATLVTVQLNKSQNHVVHDHSNYICGGAREVYSALQKIVQPHATTDCPAGYISLFQVD